MEETWAQPPISASSRWIHGAPPRSRPTSAVALPDSSASYSSFSSWRGHPGQEICYGPCVRLLLFVFLSAGLCPRIAACPPFCRIQCHGRTMEAARTLAAGSPHAAGTSLEDTYHKKEELGCGPASEAEETDQAVVGSPSQVQPGELGLLQ